MDLKSKIFLIASIMTTFGITMMPSETYAATSQNSITITPINEVS